MTEEEVVTEKEVKEFEDALAEEESFNSLTSKEKSKLLFQIELMLNCKNKPLELELRIYECKISYFVLMQLDNDACRTAMIAYNLGHRSYYILLYSGKFQNFCGNYEKTALMFTEARDIHELEVQPESRFPLDELIPIVLGKAKKAKKNKQKKKKMKKKKEKNTEVVEVEEVEETIIPPLNIEDKVKRVEIQSIELEKKLKAVEKNSMSGFEFQQTLVAIEELLKDSDASQKLILYESKFRCLNSLCCEEEAMITAKHLHSLGVKNSIVLRIASQYYSQEGDDEYALSLYEETLKVVGLVDEDKKVDFEGEGIVAKEKKSDENESKEKSGSQMEATSTSAENDAEDEVPATSDCAKDEVLDVQLIEVSCELQSNSNTSNVSVNLALSFDNDDRGKDIIPGLMGHYHVEVSCLKIKEFEDASRICGLEDHKNILCGKDVFVVDSNKYVIVYGRVSKLENYFNLMGEVFKKNVGKSLGEVEKKKRWWKYIEKDFKQIFRYFLSLELIELFIIVLIFVKQYDAIEILAGKKKDILELREKMMYIIGLPFGIPHDATEYDLPLELGTFIGMLEISFDGIDLNYVLDADGRLILDSPFFWTPDERIRYLRTLRDSIRDLDFNSQIFFDYLSKNRMNPSSQDKDNSWKEMIQSGTYTMIYHTSATNFRFEHDLIRYIGAVLTHYRQYPDKNLLTKVEIEEELREMFPTMYSHLVKVVWKHFKSLGWSLLLKERFMVALLSVSKAEI